MRYLTHPPRGPYLPFSAMGGWLGMALLVLFLAAHPHAALSAGPSPRLADPVAAGVSLRQLAETDARLAETLRALAAEASRTGSVRVAVKTAVAFAPESRLNEAQRLEQRRDIAGAAGALRSALPQAKSFEALADKPYVILRLDAAGLARLETIPGLTRIAAEEAFNWRRDYVQLKTAARARSAQANSRLASGVKVQPRIIGGTDAAPTTHPFQVGILDKRIKSNFHARYCGGTLVSPTFVVTAAHCSENIVDPTREVQVLVGTPEAGQGRPAHQRQARHHPPPV